MATLPCAANCRNEGRHCVAAGICKPGTWMMCGCSEHSRWFRISRTTFFVMPAPRSTNLIATCSSQRQSALQVEGDPAPAAALYPDTHGTRSGECAVCVEVCIHQACLCDALRRHMRHLAPVGGVSTQLHEAEAAAVQVPQLGVPRVVCRTGTQLQIPRVVCRTGTQLGILRVVCKTAYSLVYRGWSASQHPQQLLRRWSDTHAEAFPGHDAHGALHGYASTLLSSTWCSVPCSAVCRRSRGVRHSGIPGQLSTAQLRHL